jgi:hypothetical protein
MILILNRTVTSGGKIMDNELNLMNKWLEVNQKIKMKKILIQRHLGDAMYQIELQELRKEKSKLKVKIDNLRKNMQSNIQVEGLPNLIVMRS